MNLGALLSPFQGVGYRHIPEGSPFGVLDLRFCGVQSSGRWHYAGQPTLYLACAEGVAVTEFGRHFEVNRPGLAPVARALFSVEVALSAALDLRDPSIGPQLGLNAATDYLDEKKTQAIANLVRTTCPAEGILVPPAGNLDKADQWNVSLRQACLESAGNCGIVVR